MASDGNPCLQIKATMKMKESLAIEATFKRHYQLCHYIGQTIFLDVIKLTPFVNEGVWV